MFDESIIPNPRDYETLAKLAAVVILLIEKNIITEEEFKAAAVEAGKAIRENDPLLKTLRELGETLTNATRKNEGPATP